MKPHDVARARHITIIQAHPDPRGGHFGHALADAYAKGASEGGHAVERIDVAALAFPLVRCRADFETGAIPEAIRQAQASIAGADHLVMIFPIWNSAVPALVRGFLEQTFRPGFMFPHLKAGEKLGFFSALSQGKILTGKTARIVVTMAMPAFVYRWYFRPHPEKNTLRLSGAAVTESLIGRVDSTNDRSREQWLRKMCMLGRESR
jgi:putative NADPH-quinone reductase